METKLLSNETAFLKDLDKPVLHNLAYVLRHPELWPKDFVWNFNKCDKCAMRLAHDLWFKNDKWIFDKDNAPSYMARAFAMPLGETQQIFMNKTWSKDKILELPIPFIEKKYKDITPEMVADEIDRYVATRAE